MTNALPDAGRLVTFAHVARLGSMTAAARGLGVTTSAVSQQMSTLEAECGVQLFDRGPGGAALTGAGRALLERADHLVSELEQTQATIAQLSGELAGRVRVSAIASAASAVVLPSVKVLEQSAPQVTMAVAIREPSESLAALDDGRADLALIDVYDHVPLALPDHLAVEEVLTEPLVLVTPREGAGVPRRPTLAHVKQHSWVMPPADSACGAATRYACRSAGYDPRIAWETEDLLLLVAAVSRGQGIALLPRRAVADSVAPVTMRRLINPVLKRRLLLVCRRTAAQRPIVRACMDALHHVGRQAPAMI